MSANDSRFTRLAMARVGMSKDSDDGEFSETFSKSVRCDEWQCAMEEESRSNLHNSSV
jgi:hypothetical protein